MKVPSVVLELFYMQKDGRTPDRQTHNEANYRDSASFLCKRGKKRDSEQLTSQFLNRINNSSYTLYINPLSFVLRSNTMTDYFVLGVTAKGKAVPQMVLSTGSTADVDHVWHQR